MLHKHITTIMCSSIAIAAFLSSCSRPMDHDSGTNAASREFLADEAPDIGFKPALSLRIEDLIIEGNRARIKLLVVRLSSRPVSIKQLVTLFLRFKEEWGVWRENED